MNWIDNLDIDKHGNVVYDENKSNFNKKYVKENKLVFWIEGNPRYLFKACPSTRNIFNELFASSLLKKTGYYYVDTRPAKIVPKKVSNLYIAPYENKGIICRDYIKDRKEVASIRLSQFGVNSITVNVNSLTKTIKDFIKCQRANNKNFILDPEFNLDIDKLILFDFMTLQHDRASVNIEFQLEKIAKNFGMLSLSPIFDNEICLLAQRTDLVNSITSKQRINFYYKDLVNIIDNFTFAFDVEGKLAYNHENNKKYLAERITENEDLFATFTEFCKVSPKQIIDDIETSNKGYKVEEKYSLLTEFIYNYEVVSLFKECLKYATKEQTKELNSIKEIQQKLDYVDDIGKNQTSQTLLK